ncbi:TPA: hypothetical protein ACYLN4_001076 [Burkholderia lata]
MIGQGIHIAFYTWWEMIHRQGNPAGIVVSIRNPGAQLPEFEPGWKAIHYETFHDIDSRFHDFQMMTYRQAFRTAVFVERQARREEINEIAIHCQDGVSRSAAVAVAVAERLGVSLEQPTDGANLLVLRKMRFALAVCRMLRPIL